MVNDAPEYHLEVLNACRRQRNAHVLGFGATTVLIGAQRLSASKECSCVNPAIVAQPQRTCSTPVGVKGMLIVMLQAFQSSILIVLNACRRQRNAHAVLQRSSEW